MWTEAVRVKQCVYPALCETEGALALLDDARRGVWRAWRYNLKKDSPYHDYGPLRRPTIAPENRVWLYMKYALNNASWLGPRESLDAEREVMRRMSLKFLTV
jgi:hypothetical protein